MSSAPSRASAARRATLVALPTALIAGGITAWIISSNLSSVRSSDSGPIEDVAVTEIEGTEAICANLVDGLPQQIDGADQRAVTGHPESLAWGDPPIVMVCGVAQPEGLDGAPVLNAVNSVTWKVDEGVDTTEYGLPGDNTLWTAVDREVFIAVAVPTDTAGSVAIAPISKVINERLPSIEGS